MPRHTYERSPHSNAGNCVCGMDYESRAHPHPYTKSVGDDLCVCAYPADHEIHTDADTARPTPAAPATTGLLGTDAAREAVRQARGHDAEPATRITFAR